MICLEFGKGSVHFHWDRETAAARRPTLQRFPGHLSAPATAAVEWLRPINEVRRGAS